MRKVRADKELLYGSPKSAVQGGLEIVLHLRNRIHIANNETKGKRWKAKSQIAFKLGRDRWKMRNIL